MRYVKYLAMFFIMAIAFLMESDDYSYYLSSGMDIQYPSVSYTYLDDEEKMKY